MRTTDRCGERAPRRTAARRWCLARAHEHAPRVGGRRSPRARVRAVARGASRAGRSRSGGPDAASTASQRSPMPSLHAATVATIGGRQSASAERSSICSRSRRRLGNSGAIGLVDDEHIADLEQTRLVRLHRVAPARVDHHDRGVGFAHDLDLDLADAHRLDEHPRLADCVEQPDRLGRRERGRRDGPRVAIERMKTPGSVAWSCMRTRSPRIAPPEKGDDGSTASTATSMSAARSERDDLARERRLARARRTGEADCVRLAAEGIREPPDVRAGAPPCSTSDRRRASAPAIARGAAVSSSEGSRRRTAQAP